MVSRVIPYIFSYRCRVYTDHQTFWPLQIHSFQLLASRFAVAVAVAVAVDSSDF